MSYSSDSMSLKTAETDSRLNSSLGSLSQSLS